MKKLVWVMPVLMLANVVWCTPTDSTTLIEEIIITGEKTSNYKLVQRSIQTEKPHDIGDIFNTTAGFGVIKRGNFAMEPVLRSFKYEQLTIQYDGGVRSLHSCPNRMDPITVHVCPEEIKKIEIIKGPYRVRNGQSMGGIVNIIRNKPQFSDSLRINGDISLGYETNGNSKYSHGNINVVNSRYFVNVSANLKDYGNYENGDDLEIPSSFESQSFGNNIGFRITENQILQASYKLNLINDVLHAGLPMDADKDHSHIANIAYSLYPKNGTLKLLDAKLYGSWVDHVMTNKYRPNYTAVHAETSVESETLGGKVELQFQADKNTKLYTGIDYLHLNRDGVRTREIHKNMCNGMAFDPPKLAYDLVWQDSYLNDYGAFVELHNRISDKININTGVRLDLTNAAINDPAEDFSELYNDDLKGDSKLTCNAFVSSNYAASESVNIIASLGKGSRSPGLDERYINHLTIGKDAHEYVGNPHLKHEDNYQTDLELDYKQDKLRVNANVFYSKFDNYISAVVDESIPRKYLSCNDPKYAKVFTNIDDAYQYGFEFTADYDINKRWNIAANASYTYAQNKTLDEPLPEIPPFMTNLSISYRNDLISSKLHARFASRQDRVSASFNEQETPSFQVFNYYLSLYPLDFLELNFFVKNILNETYYEHLSRSYKNQTEQGPYYESGRNFGLSAKFFLK